MSGRAYTRGFEAGLTGKSATDNPYKQSGPHGQWFDGFDAGTWERAKREDQTQEQGLPDGKNGVDRA